MEPRDAGVWMETTAHAKHTTLLYTQKLIVSHRSQLKVPGSDCVAVESLWCELSACNHKIEIRLSLGFEMSCFVC